MNKGDTIYRVDIGLLGEGRLMECKIAKLGPKDAVVDEPTPWNSTYGSRRSRDDLSMKYATTPQGAWAQAANKIRDMIEDREAELAKLRASLAAAEWSAYPCLATLASGRCTPSRCSQAGANRQIEGEDVNPQIAEQNLIRDIEAAGRPAEVWHNHDRWGRLTGLNVRNSAGRIRAFNWPGPGEHDREWFIRDIAKHLGVVVK